MKELQILMNAFSVQAILKGRKTQTRRVDDRLAYINQEPDAWRLAYYEPPNIYVFVNNETGEVRHVACRFTKGQHRWVRETWKTSRQFDDLKPSEVPKDSSLWYPADRSSDRRLGAKPGKTRPSIFMPRWVSRILLEVARARVERVQEISDSDAWSEGAWWWRYDDASGPPLYVRDGENRDCFGELWDSINAKRGFGWNANLWVWVIEFSQVPDGTDA